MRYDCEVIIDKPADEVLRLFDSTENLYEWMEGLENFEHLEGTAGEVGAKSKLSFKMGKRSMELIETILTENLPDEYKVSYDSPQGYNEVTISFVPLDDQRTAYRTHNYFKMGGFMKVFAFLMPGMFKKQSMKYLNAFKAFAERS